MSGMARIRRTLFAAATLAVCGTLAVGMTSQAPLILYPITLSLQPGLYVRTFESPAAGLIAAFSVPEAARRYKASIGEHVHQDFLFMKPSDHVCCCFTGRLAVNGKWNAPLRTFNESNQPLPVWRGCRLLTSEKFFMVSTYIWSSFDSRHFGPTAIGRILGVYQNLASSSEFNSDG